MNDFFSEMNNRTKTGLIIGVLSIVALMCVAMYWFLHERYQVLFSDLDSRDAASIVSELERMKVDYRLGDGGNQILVSEKNVHEVRLKLMGSDKPLTGGVGFEIFDNSDFGMTEFAQKINYQRALQGELTRTIISLQEVKHARVHLVMPDKGLFKKQSSEPSASITLFLHTGKNLAAQQILGMQRLVAAAVPNLQSKYVTVSDQDGMTLSQEVSSNEAVQGISVRLQQKKSVEAYLSDKLNTVLARAIGDNQAMVSVDAVLDFNQIRTTEDKIIPVRDDQGKGILRRRESNFGGSSKKSSKGNVTTEVEYRMGHAIAEIIETPGRIIKLSVGALVPAGMEEESQNKIRELIAVTIGFDESRGDAIAIYPVAAVPEALVKSEEIVELNEWSATTDKVISSEKKPIDPMQKFLFYMVNYSLQILTAGLVFLLFLFVCFFVITRKNEPLESRLLTDEQRIDLLEKVERWLHDDAKPESKV